MSSANESSNENSARKAAEESAMRTREAAEYNQWLGANQAQQKQQEVQLQQQIAKQWGSNS